MEKIEKITEENVLKEHEKLSKLSSSEKDFYLAFLFVVVNKTTDILRSIIIDHKILEKNKQKSEILSNVEEIEDILSLGPKWLNYTHKVKKKK